MFLVYWQSWATSHYMLPEHFHHPQKTPCTISSYSPFNPTSQTASYYLHQQISLLWTYHMNGIIQHVVFSDLLLLLSRSDQIRSVAQSCPTLCDPMNCSTPGVPVHHQLPEFTQIHIHRVSDASQPSHPLSSPSPAPNASQHQSFFQWVNSLHEVAKVLEFQL